MTSAKGGHVIASEFLIVYADADGRRVESLPEEAARLTPEDLAPPPAPVSYKGQPNLSGWYWFATTDEHVLYKSRLALQALRMLDFNPVVEAIAAQPFGMMWRDPTSKKKPKVHVPDYFVKRSVGRDLVVDVKASRYADKPKFKSVAAASRRACDAIGWDYEVVTGYDPVFLTNMQWLAAYRSPQVMSEEIAATILETVEDPAATATIGKVINAGSIPALTRPVVFHLMWKGILVADLSEPLSSTSVVRLAKRGEVYAA